MNESRNTAWNPVGGELFFHSEFYDDPKGEAALWGTDDPSDEDVDLVTKLNAARASDLTEPDEIESARQAVHDALEAFLAKVVARNAGEDSDAV